MLDIQRETYHKIEDLPDGQMQEDLFKKIVKGKKNNAAYVEFCKSMTRCNKSFQPHSTRVSQ